VGHARPPPADAGHLLRIGDLRRLAQGRVDRARASAGAPARAADRRAGPAKRIRVSAGSGRSAGRRSTCTASRATFC
jgi:hypothetical protein